MTRARRLASTLLLVAGLACGRAPAPPAVVTDPEGLLARDQRQRISRHHAVLLRDHDIDYRVEIAPGVRDLPAYGVQRFSELDVGSLSSTGRGLLLVLDPAGDRVRLEVGQDLEGVFTDAFVAYLQERQMVPFFRAGRVADGILATTELVVARARDAERNASFSPPTRAGAAGGGAGTRAALGEGPDDRFASGPDAAARGTPQDTLEAYLEAMEARNGNPALDLYSAETRDLLGGWVMTPAQMDTVARLYRRCRAEAPRLGEAGRRAVIRYPAEQRQCSPWFLVAEGGRWRLDLATAQRVLRFGADNAWHFAVGGEHPYAFAFTDWRLDRNGFPHER